MSKLSQHFNGKTAVVTGAASGMGRELAIQLSKLGCDLALCDINQEELEATRKLLEPETKCLCFKVDMGKKEHIREFAYQVEKNFENLHFVFNNAGVAYTGSLIENNQDRFEWLMNINFWGVVYSSQTFLPQLIKSGGGHIINTSSILGCVGLARHAAYCASKFGVRGYTESLAQEMELEGHPIKVSCVHPGGIRTNIVSSSVLEGQIDRDKMNQAFEQSTYLDADVATTRILKAVAKGKRKILIGPDAYILDWISRIFGNAYMFFVKKIAKARVYDLQNQDELKEGNEEKNKKTEEKVNA